MNIMRDIVLISGFIVSTSLYAATDFPDDLIPAELAETFAQGDIYSSLPDNFPTPVLPAGIDLYVVGSLENGSYHQQVLLGTALSGAVLRDLLTAAYGVDGWVDISSYPSALRLCHDEHGVLEFRMATPTATANRVLANKYGSMSMTPDTMTCAEQQAYLNGGPATTPYAVFRESMPALEAPPEAVESGPSSPLGGISSSSGGSGYYYKSESARSMTVPDISLEELKEHFAQQLVAQGWQEDGDVVGVKSASSVWFKTVQIPESSQSPAAEMALTGVFILLDLQEDKYRLTFTLQAGEPGGLGVVGIY